MPAATVLAAALGAAWLVELAPGEASSAHELDLRLSGRSVETLRSQREISRTEWLGRLARGDLGDSVTFQRPIVELLGERLPVTARLVAQGLALAWAVALASLVAGVALRWRIFDGSLTVLSGTLLAVPAAPFALFCLYAEWPEAVVVAAAALPWLYRHLRNLAERQMREPYVLAARARGVREGLVIARHVLGRVAPVALTMLGVSVSMALGAAAPVEALCDLPGIGQLAWEAALTRDLPLLTALTIVVAAATAAANLLSDLALALVEPDRR